MLLLIDLEALLILAVYGMLVFMFEKAASIVFSMPLFSLERLFDIPLIVLLYVLSCVSELCGIRGRLLIFLPIWFLTGIIIIFRGNELYGWVTALFLVAIFISNVFLIQKYRRKDELRFLPSQKKEDI